MQAGLGLGAPPQNVRLAKDNFLLDHLGGGFDLVYLADKTGIPAAILAATQEAKQQSIPIKLIAITQEEGTVTGADVTLFDPENRVATRYRVAAGGA